MASPADIEAVKTLLDGVDDPWDDTKIGTILDSAGSVAKAMQAFWSQRVNATYRLMDVSESGSSRSMSSIYKNAMEQLARWDKIVSDERARTDQPSGVRIHRITRDMPK